VPPNQNPKDRLIILRQQAKPADLVLRPGADMRRGDVPHVVHVEAQQRAHFGLRSNAFARASRSLRSRSKSMRFSQSTAIGRMSSVPRCASCLNLFRLFRKSVRAASNTFAPSALWRLPAAAKRESARASPHPFHWSLQIEKRSSAITEAISPVTPYRP